MKTDTRARFTRTVHLQKGSRPRSGRARPGARVTPSCCGSDPLAAYLRDVAAQPLLDATEEREIARRYLTTRSPALLRRLVNANLRLVIKLAREYYTTGARLLDLIQEGNVGLIKAVERYNPERGPRLSTYAAWWIRAYILRFLMGDCRLVKLGTTRAEREMFFNLRRETEKLERGGVAPDRARLAARFHVDERTVSEMEQRMTVGEVSLDATSPGTNGEHESRAIDRLAASDELRPDRRTEDREFMALLSRSLDEFRDRLSGRDLLLWSRRLSSDEPENLTRLGERFGLSPERVRQLEQRLIARLRAFLDERRVIPA